MATDKQIPIIDHEVEEQTATELAMAFRDVTGSSIESFRSNHFSSDDRNY